MVAEEEIQRPAEFTRKIIPQSQYEGKNSCTLSLILCLFIFSLGVESIDVYGMKRVEVAETECHIAE